MLVVGGGVTAIVARTAEFETDRVATEQYASAQVEAASTRENAVDELNRYFALASDSKATFELTSQLSAVPVELLDATTLAALTPLIDKLKSSLLGSAPLLAARPEVVGPSDSEQLALRADQLRRWASAVGADWKKHSAAFDIVSSNLRALRIGIMAVAGSAIETARGVLDSSPSASAETRAHLGAVTARLSRHIEEGTQPDAALLDYVKAAQAVRESHAAAVAAAAAAASGSGGGARVPGLIGSPWPGVDVNNPPVVIFDGAYVGYQACPYDSVNLVSGYPDNGEILYFYYPDPYEGRILNFEDKFWILIINACL